MISNGRRTEWSAIRSLIIRVTTKSDDREVRFVDHEHDFKQNWTTRSPFANYSLPLQLPKKTNTFVRSLSVSEQVRIKTSPNNYKVDHNNHSTNSLSWKNYWGMTIMEEYFPLDAVSTGDSWPKCICPITDNCTKWFVTITQLIHQSHFSKL